MIGKSGGRSINNHKIDLVCLEQSVLNSKSQFIIVSMSSNFESKILGQVVFLWHGQDYLTHWGRVTHICVSELTIIDSGNGLSPGRRQAIIWNNAGLLLIEPSGTNFSEIWIGIETFSIKEMHLNMSSAKWRLLDLGLNEVSCVLRQFSAMDCVSTGPSETNCNKILIKVRNICFNM